MPGTCSRFLLSVNPAARHAKLNLTGSIKDRLTVGILEKA
jgi:hypothetical protein